MEAKTIIETLLGIGKGLGNVLINELKTAMEISEIERKYTEVKTIFDTTVNTLQHSSDIHFENCDFVLRKNFNQFRFFKENNPNETFVSHLVGFTGSYENIGGFYYYQKNWVYNISADPSLFFRLCMANNLYPKIFSGENERWYRFLTEAVNANLINSNGGIDKRIENYRSKINSILLKYQIIDDNHIATDEIYKYLNCDKLRIGTAPYEEQMLLDANQGHWDIKEPIKIGDKIYHPRHDIFKDIKSGTVGIDFGTKSTIVCFQNEKNQTLPLPIGISEDDELSKDRNENPTIMEFCSLEKFMEAYNKSESRPETLWADLKISKKAKDDFGDVSDDEFNAFLDNLKQWAGGRNNKIKIVPTKEKDKTYDLKSFLDIKDDDFNPIEYYAYLIGLFVNNMRLGIHLNYYLSIPVKYDANVKAKLRDSFEKGIRKSLPKEILSDSKMMKRFFVKINRKDDNGNDVYLTEPLAYAVCALQRYKIDPENEPANYAVFDFGGGTVDYDFGVWDRPDDEDDYNFKIKTFGGDGMAIMGGENILEDLACNIFQQNLDVLRKDDGDKIRQFQFQLGPTCSEFDTWEVYVADTIPASRNMFKMKSALRKYWENARENLIDASDKKSQILFNEVQFTDTKGDKSTLEIKTTIEFIEEFFKKKINEAIDNFFVAMDSVKDNFAGNEVKIFLAGNSSKSPYVKDLFDEKIRNREQEEDQLTYQIYYPLGSQEANDDLFSRGIEPNKNITGKTGVAFGLIDCRESGVIQIESEVGEKFGFFLGKSSKNETFKVLENLQNGRPVIGEWFDYRKVKPGANNFQIYYTNLPESLTGEMEITKSKTKTCFYDECSEPGFKIYLRATGPHTLEYTISEEEPGDNYKGKCETIEL